MGVRSKHFQTFWTASVEGLEGLITLLRLGESQPSRNRVNSV